MLYLPCACVLPIEFIHTHKQKPIKFLIRSDPNIITSSDWVRIIFFSKPNKSETRLSWLNSDLPTLITILLSWACMKNWVRPSPWVFGPLIAALHFPRSGLTEKECENTAKGFITIHLLHPVIWMVKFWSSNGC